MRSLAVAFCFCLFFLGLVVTFPSSGAARAEQEELSNLFWPAPPAQPRIFFVRNISSYKDLGIKRGLLGKLKDLLVGDRPFSFVRPMDIAVGKDATMYVADMGAAKVYIYNPGQKLFDVIARIDDATALVSPVGVAVSSDNRIFIADSFLGKVFAVDSKGKSHFQLGEKEGIFRPTGIFAAGQKLYVTDVAASQVVIFDLEGRRLASFGKKGKSQGEFNFPTHIFVDAQNRIYVTDAMNFRVQVFDENGRFVRSIGSAGDSSGHFSRPKGVAVDSHGHIYVADALFDNVQVFDLEEKFLLGFGEAGTGDGEFWLPTGVTTDEEDNIYVADSYNRRVSVYRYVGKE